MKKNSRACVELLLKHKPNLEDEFKGKTALEMANDDHLLVRAFPLPRILSLPTSSLIATVFVNILILGDGFDSHFLGSDPREEGRSCPICQ